MSKNEVAVINPNMFGDIDFGKLGGTISKLAQGSSILSDKEKEMAISVITEWEEDVIAKLFQKSNEAANVINLLDPKNVSPYYDTKNINDIFTDDQLMILASRNGFTAALNKYIKTKEDLDDLKCPEAPIVELDTTMEQQYQDQAKFSVEQKKYHMTLEALRRQKTIASKNVLIELNKTKEVQELLQKAKSFHNKVNSMRSKCKDLSQIAKLNIVISSEEIRETLKEMLQFGTEL